MSSFLFPHVPLGSLRRLVAIPQFGITNPSAWLGMLGRVVRQPRLSHQLFYVRSIAHVAPAIPTHIKSMYATTSKKSTTTMVVAQLRQPLSPATFGSTLLL